VPEQPSHTGDHLLEALRSGNEQAFAAIYEQFAPALINYAATRLIELEEARDIIHDLFVHLWEERATITITHSLRAFLFAAVRYRIIDHIRRNVKKRAYADSLEALYTAIAMNNGQELEAKDLEGNIERAISQLPPRVQEVYRLSRHQHRSIAEIAKELRLSPQTVKNQLTTALSLLRSFLHQLPLIWVVVGYSFIATLLKKYG